MLTLEKNLLKIQENMIRLHTIHARTTTKMQITDPLRTDHTSILLDFSLTVKAATSIFISGCGSAISSA